MGSSWHSEIRENAMNMSRLKNVCTIGLLLMSLAGLSGCAAVAAGAMAGGGTYAYVTGWGTVTYNVDLDQAYEAALEACDELDLLVQKQERHLSEAGIEAKDGDSTVWIDLDSEGIRVTKVAVRVGVLGDKVASERIHDRIAKELR